MLVRISFRPGFLAAIVAMVAIAVPRPVPAEFYQWTDEEGQRRISNIPPNGVREDGTIVDTYHPYSIVAQHARMREQLEHQAMDIEHAEAEAATKNDPGSRRMPFSLDILDGFGR